MLLKNLKAFRSTNVIICGHINLLPLSALIAKFFRTPLVLTTHGTEVWERPAGWKGDWMWGAVDLVISVSEFTRDKLLKWAQVDAERAIVIHNAIELSKYQPGPKPEYLLDRYKLRDKKVILTVGRLDPDERAKGFDEIIELLPKLLVDSPDLAYLVVGSGDDLTRLKQKALQMGVSDKVVFTGWIDEEEKSDHYRLADAYVMPSRLEGFGYVFLEALACGIPVVGSKLDGSRDALLNGELGDLVDPGNSEELLRSIQLVLQKEKSVPSKLSKFSIQRFNKEIADAILTLCTHGRYTNKGSQK